MFRLDGRCAVVTGVLGKLGPVWAEALLDAGAAVLGIDREGAPESPRFSTLAARYGDRLSLAWADVRDRRSLDASLTQCRRLYGEPDVLVNNAGIDAPPVAQVYGARIEDVPFDVSAEIFQVNAVGAFLVAQVFGGAMVERRCGSIVNVGSLYASVAPDPRLYCHLRPTFLKPPAYGASKAALVNLTRYLAVAWAPSGVRVNALSPGGVLGNQDAAFQRKFCERVPLGRMALEEDLVGPLLFLASDASSYVTGIELRVDGGYTAC